MGRPPYDDPDPLDHMYSDCVSVTHGWPELPTDPELATGDATPPTGGSKPPTSGFEVPRDAVALGELHFHLE